MAPYRASFGSGISRELHTFDPPSAHSDALADGAKWAAQGAHSKQLFAAGCRLRLYPGCGPE